MTDINYVYMLRESLEKKVDILEVLQIKNRQQTAILQDNNSTPDDLEKNIEQKGQLVDRILQLDEGFETLFNRVKPEIEAHKDEYAEEIKKMQDLIRRITDLSVDVEALERKNKEYARARFSNVKKEAREIKKKGDVVSSYYKNMMSQTTSFDPQFMDRKK